MQPCRTVRGADLTLLPFGVGRRMFLGMVLGLASLGLPLASLLFHFDCERPGPSSSVNLDMTKAFGLTA